ncbi:MAG: Gfo/Idh/MocA family oxidoreductase, partial [Ignavibacteria bacterium]|nr:Gfo/Idh/MocA family oxidoreductase [Ignavibacteria bacterium]
MKKIKAGIVGTGHLGKIHTKLFREVEHCDFIGIYDLDFERAKEVATEFGVKAFKELDELLAE